MDTLHKGDNDDYNNNNSSSSGSGGGSSNSSSRFLVKKHKASQYVILFSPISPSSLGSKYLFHSTPFIYIYIYIYSFLGLGSKFKIQSSHQPNKNIIVFYILVLGCKIGHRKTKESELSVHKHCPATLIYS
jgi:hypothetical protein